MKRDYLKPSLNNVNVMIEAGFAISYGAGTPGGEIGFGDYGEEL